MTRQDAPSLQKIKGGCLCGAVSFEVINTFEKLFLCSCDQCRQITGSAFASNLFATLEGFDWLGGVGDIISYQVPGREISKSFCRICGSGVPWPNRDATKMIVPAGSLSEPVNVAERVRIFASELPSWASNLEQVSTHAKFPVALGSEPTGLNPVPTDKSKKNQIGEIMITCHVTYKIDPAKTADFEVYAKAWIPLVERFGGTHHGYFLPHEGPKDLAFAAFSFPSLAAYETYRTQSSADPACIATYDFAVRTKCILRYDRHFLRPVLDGDLSGIFDQQA